MRDAALQATTYPEPIQRALAFHELRVDEIGQGDHEVEVGDPQLVAHVLPKGIPNKVSLSEGGPVDEVPPNFLKEDGFLFDHKYGKITSPADRGPPQQAYSLLPYPGGLEVVSGVEISEFGGEELFLASRTEVKLTATVNWAQEVFGDEYESDKLIVLVTLLGVQGERIRVPDHVRAGVNEPTFVSDRVNPWPAKVPVESPSVQDTYDQLADLFDRLWTDSGMGSSIFYRDGTEAYQQIVEYL